MRILYYTTKKKLQSKFWVVLFCEEKRESKSTKSGEDRTDDDEMDVRGVAEG